MSDGSQPETSALVKRARSGDRDAFASLVTRYEEGIYGYILGRCRDPEKAQEVVQDAFITAYTTLAKLEKPESFRSWIIGIALNLLRRRKKEIANIDLLSGAHDKRETGLGGLANQETLDAVRGAIEELPENYRTALQMHYFDKQRGRVIGDELGVSEGAVHMILLRARKALAEKLKAFAPEQD
ncbi:MAG: sigma-70 family RNA polymerase sigma factor [Planctomycetes bacterium]|nr:sigma-70 family RNA polymerase sigma factor [Planctomycetota bacterium]